MTHSNGTPWSSEPPLKPTHWATIAFQRHVLELARESNVVVKTDGAEFDKVDLAIKLLWQQQGYAEGMRAFLLAPTREAVVGIAARLELELGLACSAFYGSRVEFWDKDDWGCALRDTTVLVCTPEAARQAVEKEYVSTQHINLLILEDCHLAKKRHPYAQLVRLCSKHDEATTPRIIGMSAHPTQTCVDVLHATLAEMASHADSPAAAVAPIVYERYEKQDAFANSPDPAARTGPTEASASVEVGVDETLAIESLVAGLKQGDAAALGRAGQFSSDSGRRGEEFVRACANIHARLGLWCFYRFVELKLEKQLMFPSHHQPPVLNVDPGSTLQWLRDQRGQCDFAATSRLARVEELIVTKLLLVEDYGSSQAIVFVRTRAECRVISEYLNEKVFAPLGILGFSGCILGRASRLDTASVGLPHFQQTMSDFAFGLSRVLVATTVSAEGLHLPLCRAVIVADEVDAPLVLGQMQQQAEPTCGSVHYLAEDGDFRNWVRFQRLLDGTKPSGRSDVPNGAPRSTATPAPPSQAPVDRELRGCLRRQQGAEATSDSRGVALPRVLDLQSSVQCVSEFCQSLPAKRISTNGAKLFELVERWCDTSKAPSFKATLQLPPVPRLYPDQMADLFASPFEGEFERSKAAAKASAALLACKRLLEYGYLRASLKSVFCKEKALLCNDAESKPAVLMHACVSV